MTPQPQPAAYWIELLEELTGGIPFEIKKLKYKKKFVSLKEYLDFQVWMNYQLDSDFKYELIECAKYLTSGQNVIDAAVEFNDYDLWKDSYRVYQRLISNLYEQTSLYERCNGIKR